MSDTMIDQELVAEPLPDSPRVIYGKNPLMEVLCQVRFPPILKIAVEPPAAFQERIRTQYPRLVERQITTIELPPVVPPVLAQALRAAVPKGQGVIYDFATADEKWKVTLTRDFLALSTSAYRRWEEFLDHLKGPLEALTAIYAPAFFTRIGLRYQDLVRRSVLNAEEVNWSDLIKAHLAGVLGIAEVAPAVDGLAGQVIIRFPRFGGKAQMNFGIVQTVDAPKEDCFLIDSDFYTEERIEIADVNNILAYFNRQSGKLFRWCIQNRLHEAMEPSPVETSR